MKTGHGDRFLLQKDRYKMFEKKFNNYTYVRCGECGITGKKKFQKDVYCNQDLKTYLTKYQWAYSNGYFLPRLPDNLREIFYELKGMFNVAVASIDEMLDAIRWLKRAEYENKKERRQNRKNKHTKRNQRRRG